MAKKATTEERKMVLTDPHTLVLGVPVKNGEETISKIIFRRPRGKEMRETRVVSEMNIGDFLDLAAQISDQPPTVFDALEPEDVFAVTEVVGGFLQSSRKTGKSS